MTQSNAVGWQVMDTRGNNPTLFPATSPSRQTLYTNSYVTTSFHGQQPQLQHPQVSRIAHPQTANATGGSSPAQPRTQATLQNLPAELRAVMYRSLFQGATLEINRDTMALCSPSDEFAPYRILTNVDSDIVRTSRFFRNEALQFLNACTSLDIKHYFGRNDPLAHVPDAFLARIEDIKVEFEAFVHVNRRRLSSLKRVHLTYEVDAPGGYSDVVHVMNCDTCGGVRRVLHEAMEGVLSWQWFAKQIVHLGQEEEFKVKMTVLWSFYAAVEAGIVRALL